MLSWRASSGYKYDCGDFKLLMTHAHMLENILTPTSKLLQIKHWHCQLKEHINFRNRNLSRLGDVHLSWSGLNCSKRLEDRYLFQTNFLIENTEMGYEPTPSLKLLAKPSPRNYYFNTIVDVGEIQSYMPIKPPHT